MLIISIFHQSIELEQALAELEATFVSRENILVAFMDGSGTNRGVKEYNPHPFEIGMCTATAGAVIGASCGFELTLGPILLGIIGAIVGYVLGAGIYLWIKKGKAFKQPLEEVTVIIECKEEQSTHINELLWKYQAISVGQVPSPS